MFDGLFNNTRVYTNGLDAMWLKNSVIANNIANVNTPNYKASTVEFEAVFQKALNGGDLQGTLTHEKHIPIGGGCLSTAVPRVNRSENTMKLDGNGVDIEFEMAELYQNKAQYDYLMQKLNGAYSLIKKAVREGR